MFVIFGSKAREKEIGRGTFLCPYEDEKRTYGHFKVSEWFTLFFIPLIKLRKGEDYVECASCGVRYPADVVKI